MKSLKFIVRLSLFVLILFAVAASTHAQQCQGYNPTMYQSPNPGTTSAVSPNLSCVSFGQTNTTTDYCGSLDTGGQLTYQSTVSGNGYASCTAYVVYCDPDFELQVTVATNQQDYNRFYNRAYDKTYTSGGCVRINTPSSNRQDYFQCGWYSCPPPPAPVCSGPPPYCGPGGTWDSVTCR